jgi:two-component system chemotaxis response regulator CheY
MRDVRVLVADDNPSMRKLLGMVLNQVGGISVDYAGNGIEAGKLHSAHRYEVIILDNAMPEMTGVEFLRANHEALTASDTSVIMVTAAPDEGVCTAGVNSDIRLHDIVVKPFDVQSLRERVQKVVDKHKTHRPKTRVSGKMARQASAYPGAGFVQKLNGKTLTLGISVSRHVATAYLTGMFLNEDQGVITNFIDMMPEIPGDTLLIDLSGVLSIDEFGLGTLLFLNGMAASAGKRTYLIAENSMISERVKAVGIPEIVPMCGHWSDVAFERYRPTGPSSAAPMPAA